MERERLVLNDEWAQDEAVTASSAGEKKGLFTLILSTVLTSVPESDICIAQVPDTRVLSLGV